MARLRLNPLPSSAQYAAFERMLENPSKAFFTISNEVKKQGGYDEKTPDGTLFAVFRGPFTGTYIFGRPRVSYIPDFESKLSATGRGAPLVRHRKRQIAALLKDLPAVIYEHNALQRYPDLSPVEAVERENADLREHAQYRISQWEREIENLKRELLTIEKGAKRRRADDYEEAPEWVPANAYEAEFAGGDFEGPPRTPDRVKARIRGLQMLIEDYKADPLRLTDPDSTSGGLIATKIYILSQAGGVDYDSVIAAIKAKPKRLLTLAGPLPIPGRREERARFARALLTTFSLNEALAAQFPNVESVQLVTGEYSGHDPKLIRYALANWKSWVNFAEQLVADRQYLNVMGIGEPSSKEHKAAARRSGANVIVTEARRFQELKVPSADFREIIKRFNSRDMMFITDTLQAAARPFTREILAETVEGRRVIQHIADRDWREVLRDHDRVVAAQREAYRRTPPATPADDAALVRFHSRNRHFTLIPGVRPLVQKDEFFVEGNEMDHCVGGYFYQRQSWCFAFRAPDGTRATLELTGNGQVRQFYGPHNGPASTATRAMLKEFQAVNAENIALMKKGQFPPAEEVKAEVNDHPAAPPVAGNPFGRRREW